MSRSGYTEDCDGRDLAMWRGRVASAMRGKRGQKLMRELLAALDEMPVKRLIRDELVKDGDVCLLGAGGRRLGIDLTDIHPKWHDTLAGKFGVATCMIQEIEWVNDEGRYTAETPEERYARVRAWLVQHIAA